MNRIFRDAMISRALFAFVLGVSAWASQVSSARADDIIPKSIIFTICPDPTATDVYLCFNDGNGTEQQWAKVDVHNHTFTVLNSNLLDYVYTAPGGSTGSFKSVLDTMIGSGNNPAQVAPIGSANTWALAQTFSVAPIFTDPAGTRSALGAVVPVVTSNAALSALSTVGSPLVDRTWNGVTVRFASSGSACTLNAGAGDGGSQVPSADGKCWLAQFPSVTADIRAWGASCPSLTDGSTYVVSAISAGFKKVFLPKNCEYIPPHTSGQNTVPDGVTIIGEDNYLSAVSVTTRASDRLYLGARSGLQNVKTISYDCDSGVVPTGTQKECPVGIAFNNSDTASQQINWVGEYITIIAGASVTGPTGVVSNDLPSIAVVNSSIGDNFYASTLGSGVGYRVVTDGASGGDTGIWALNGWHVPTQQHNGITVKQFSTNASSKAIYIDRAVDGPGLWIDDADATANVGATNPVAIVTSHSTSGQLVNVFHNTSAFNGDVVLANMASGSGSFSGNYLNFLNNSTLKFRADAQGNVTIGGYLKHPVLHAAAILAITCDSTSEGMEYGVDDANSATFNAALASGGSNHMKAYCNGSIWTVH